jgi:hypothetical protein
MKLSVDVGFSHLIEIEQTEGADTAAGQRFSGPRSNASDANHHNMGGS